MKEKPSPEMEKKLHEAALVLKTLGHPVRLRIAAGLAAEPACVHEIWECLGMPQAVVSQHLKIMKDNGLLVAHREGNRVRYFLREEYVQRLVRALGSAG